MSQASQPSILKLKLYNSKRRVFEIRLTLLVGATTATVLPLFRCFRHYRSYGGYSLLRLLKLPSYAAGLWQLHLAWGSVLRLLRLLYLQ